MFCERCGCEIGNGSKFCAKCGLEVKYQKNLYVGVMNNDLSQNDKNDSSGGIPTAIKAIIVILLLTLAAGLIAICVYLFVFSNKTSENNFGETLKIAQELVDDGKYKEAVGYYRELIDIEPESEELYIAAAKAYIAQDKKDKAIKLLKSGYERTESDKIQKLINEYSGDVNKKEIDEKATEEDLSEEVEAEKEIKQEETEIATVIEPKSVSLEIRQVDNSDFPHITMYVSIKDENGNTIEKCEKNDFEIKEIDEQGNISEASISDVYKVLDKDNINVNLVLDSSGSMDEDNKMQQAKNAASALIDKMKLLEGDKAEIISFDTYVYLKQDFTNEKDVLIKAINDINTAGNTALYDAIYSGLLQTHYEDGAKCVIAFTDGMENASSYTFDDIVDMARNTSIPVFIIGIGDDYDSSVLQELALQCSGKYYSADVNDLESILEDIYISIYEEQQDYYVVKYSASNMNNPTEFRDVVLQTSDTSEYNGTHRKSYVPKTNITGAFSETYINKDYILDFSSQRKVTESDLKGLGLAELRIARNEIFARHGRQFKDVMLNKWFYSKVWYLNIPVKYSPSDFDSLNQNPLSSLELDNANFIKEYEENMMNTRDIYPNAGSVLLSEYDLALSKNVLKNALNQMMTYANTSILEENKRLVQEAIAKEDIQY